MATLDGLTNQDLSLIRNALGRWRDHLEWEYGDYGLRKRLDDVSDKIYDIVHPDKMSADG